MKLFQKRVMNSEWKLYKGKVLCQIKFVACKDFAVLTSGFDKEIGHVQNQRSQKCQILDTRLLFLKYTPLVEEWGGTPLEEC